LSCAPKTSIIKGSYNIDKTGNINETTTKPSEDNYVYLSRIGDKAVIYLPADVYFDVRLDTSVATIATSYSPDESKIIFEVIEKKSVNEVVFNNICDILILPDVSIHLSLIDTYNSNPKNRNKSKLILVPIFNNKCIVTGYLLRFDNRDRPNNCSNNKRVEEIEQKFNDCEKGNQISCKCPKPYYHCDCLEYKYFGKCCPK